MATRSGSCNGTESTSDDRYYIFSFSYGILAVLLLVHVVTHHLWRRRKLKRNQTTIVEITANTSKKLKEELDGWSRRIKNLNPNPKLISTEVSPIEYGNGLGDIPTHWFRMKAYDMATEFVLEYWGVSSDPDKLPAFPDLLWDLRDMRKISEDVDIAVNLYEFARYRPGDFTEQHLQQFINLLSSFKRRLLPASQGLSANSFDAAQRQQGELTGSTLHLLPSNTSGAAETPL